MKKNNVILIIAGVVIAIVIAIVFVGNGETQSKNQVAGLWRNGIAINDRIQVFEFGENGYFTEITLDSNGQMNRDSYTYSISEKSQTIIINMGVWGNDSYRYIVKKDVLTLFDDNGTETNWQRISSLDFLEEEQKKRKEVLEKIWEEDQRRQEEKKIQEREHENEMQELRDEYREFREKTFRKAELKLIGKWEKDNSMFRDTHEFYENGTVVSYFSDSEETRNGTYNVYPGEINPSEKELLQFKEDTDYEPTVYEIAFNYDDGLALIYNLYIYEDYIRIKQRSSYGNGWIFNKVN